jgi:hypothetical protein
MTASPPVATDLTTAASGLPEWAIALGSVVVGAILGAGISELRDYRKNRRESIAIAAALRQEILHIGSRIADFSTDIIRIYEDSNTRINGSTLGHFMPPEPMIYPHVLGRIGQFDSKIVFCVSDVYASFYYIRQRCDPSNMTDASRTLPRNEINIFTEHCCFAALEVELAVEALNAFLFNDAKSHDDIERNIIERLSTLTKHSTNFVSM